MSEYVYAIDEYRGHWLTGEEIVRCKDCVSSYRDEDGMWCCFHGTGFYRRPTDADNYCSKGKRRDA